MNTPAEESKTSIEKRWFYTAFIVVNLVLSCYYLDLWITPNATSRALPVLTRYEEHTIAIDKYKDYTGDKSTMNGHYYSDKSPITSMIVYPFYVAYKAVGLKDVSEQKLKEYPIYVWENGGGLADGRSFLLPKTSPVFLIGDILCGCIPFVITLMIAFWAIKKIPPPKGSPSEKISPVYLAVLPFYGSFLFAYAGTFTGHLLAGFFLFLGYVFLKEKKWFLVSGLAVGLAFATEYPIGIMLPIWTGITFLREKSFKKTALFVAGMVPGALFVLWYNHHITGSVATTSYSYVANAEYQGVTNVGFSNFPQVKAMWGLTFSTYKGLLFYAPALIVMLWYFIKLNWKNLFKYSRMKVLTAFAQNYLAVTLVFYILLWSCHVLWWGGWTFGPRHFTPLALITLYEGAIYLSKIPFSKYFFYVVTFFGVLAVWMDKSTKIYMISDNPYAYSNPVFDLILPDFLKHKFNANTIPVLAFDAPLSFSIYLWIILFIAGIVFLASWYNRLFPVKLEPVSVKPKPAPKQFKKK